MAPKAKRTLKLEYEVTIGDGREEIGEIVEALQKSTKEGVQTIVQLRFIDTEVRHPDHASRLLWTDSNRPGSRGSRIEVRYGPRPFLGAVEHSLRPTNQRDEARSSLVRVGQLAPGWALECISTMTTKIEPKGTPGEEWIFQREDIIGETADACLYWIDPAGRMQYELPIPSNFDSVNVVPLQQLPPPPGYALHLKRPLPLYTPPMQPREHDPRAQCRQPITHSMPHQYSHSPYLSQPPQAGQIPRPHRAYQIHALGEQQMERLRGRSSNAGLPQAQGTPTSPPGQPTCRHLLQNRATKPQQATDTGSRAGQASRQQSSIEGTTAATKGEPSRRRQSEAGSAVDGPGVAQGAQGHSEKAASLSPVSNVAQNELEHREDGDGEDDGTRLGRTDVSGAGNKVAKKQAATRTSTDANPAVASPAGSNQETSPPAAGRSKRQLEEADAAEGMAGKKRKDDGQSNKTD